jgi:pimeloyl-ACP methyl ester carboxylesterase
MYVEVLKPRRTTRKYPVVFFHGGKETGTNFITTPDGRPGWADYFLRQGYAVYITDQPARGRSAWHPQVTGPMSFYSAPDAYRLTIPEVAGNWPQAKKHTQWPGDGRMGDAAFDQFFASQVTSLASAIEIQTLAKDSGIALLDKIGPAILIAHSQAGPYAWLLADSRPKLVKGAVVIEPSGPPFRNIIVKEDTTRKWGLPWGVTDIPLTYSPPLKDPDELKPIEQPMADGPDLAKCWVQSDPPHQLPNLKGIPILLLTSEASAMGIYEHCIAKYLTQAGVENTFTRLEQQGIHGNGHFMMLEKNSDEVAALLNRWIVEHVK